MAAPIPYRVLNLRFDLPDEFLPATIRYGFDDDPIDVSAQLRVAASEYASPRDHLAALKSEHEGAYDQARPQEERDSVDQVGVSMDVQLGEDETGRVELAVPNAHPSLGFVLFSFGEEPRAEMALVMASVRAEDRRLYGWADQRENRFQIDRASFIVPDGWIDVTDYTFESRSEPMLTVRMKREEEPELSPEERVRDLLERLDAADPSFNLIRESELVIDNAPAYEGEWTNVELGQTIRTTMIAIDTGNHSGAIIMVSGSIEAFEKSGAAWDQLRHNIEIAR